MESSSQAQSPRTRRGLAAGIFVLGALAYAGKLSNPLLQWDDRRFILNQPLIQSLTNWRRFFVEGQDGLYRPLRTLLYAVSYRFFDGRPLGYEVVGRIVGQAIAAALAVGEVTWSWLPGHGHDQSWAAVKSFPVFLVVAGVARFLAVNLLARERTQSRDLTLAELGARLLSAESQGRIAVAGVWAATRICAATPGLCTAWLAEAEAGLTVLRQVGTPFALPAQLPWPDRHCGRQGSPPPADTIERLADVLATGAGLNGAWRLVPLAGQSGNWILLGAQDRLPAEAVVAVESMTHQLGLALRNVQARQRLAADATTDALTGLANRAAFEQAVTSALASGAPAAVLYLDLDGFKAINDQRGPAAGDDVLRHVGDRLRQSVRPTDVCARLGGDEFAVLMAGLSPRSATEMANRLSATLSGPMIVAGRPIEVGASIGVAVGDRGPAHLIEAADQAMYAAKRLRAAALAP